MLVSSEYQSITEPHQSDYRERRNLRSLIDQQEALRIVLQKPHHLLLAVNGVDGRGNDVGLLEY